MPNGYSHRKYGKHSYPSEDGTSDCVYGCGCWMGPARSDGPLGIDPQGLCPNHPLDKGSLRPKIDYEDLVNQRIRTLESEGSNQRDRATKAEARLKGARKLLIEQLEESQACVQRYRNKLTSAQALAKELNRLLTS